MAAYYDCTMHVMSCKSYYEIPHNTRGVNLAYVVLWESHSADYKLPSI